ncbi:NrfD/PsrC family molybdoenzyme membrane anchor subunit [Serratia fonticola]|uniref:NrfD/PsrC family molybdoenzyme membrane anchor subunit n=1 Tax=Serratia fonticola TaxID=47917 RepID=UPI003BB65759
MLTKELYRPQHFLAIIGIMFGGYIAIEEWFFHSSFKANDGLVWTLPLVSYIFLALMSTGASILLAVGKIWSIPSLEINSKSLLCIAIGLLLGAFASLSTEMGSPLNIYWIILNPNVRSPIWWMGTLYSIELTLLFVKFIEELLNRKFINGKVLSSLTLVVAIAAALVLGAVFGTVIGRVGYAGLDASIFTLICALASGIALSSIIIGRSFYKFISPALLVVTSVLFVFLLAKYIYQSRSTVDYLIITVSIYTLAALLVSFALSYKSPLISSLLLIFSVMHSEYLFVVNGQLHTLGPKETWLGTLQIYSPNISEVAVLVFGISVAWLTYSITKSMLDNDMGNN